MPSGFRVQPPPDSPVGALVPALTPHAVSVSLPTWQDNVDYEEGHQRIKDAMTSGYPRFFIHHRIQRLADLACARFGEEGELCILLPTDTTARGCSAFLASRSPPVPSRVVPWAVHSTSPSSSSVDAETAARNRTVTIHACFFPAADFPAAKQYWQHTGEGVSSRVGERCLILLGEIDADGSEGSNSPTQATQPLGEGQEGATRFFVNGSAGGSNGSAAAGPSGRYGSKSRYQVAKGSASSDSVASIARPVVSSKLRYSTSKVRSTTSGSATPSGEGSDASGSEPPSLANSVDQLPPPTLSAAAAAGGKQLVEQDEDVLARYVEERYGRNLDLSLAPLAKLAMRRRIAGVLREQPGEAIPVEKMRADDAREESNRGVVGLTEDDVWLYPCGMNAIFHAHQLAMDARRNQGKEVGKSVCFGFPYTDTLKILEKWGPGCHFFGKGLAADLPALRQTLEAANPPILALFCEFPSNPLLRSPPLHDLRKLADEFGFMIVVDETIAGFVNVEVLPLADIVVSSLTKVFSGDSNVMGGSLVLNPKGPHYAALKAAQEATYEDAYFDEDAIYMERNSRDFQARIVQENSNTEMLCEFLRSRRIPDPPAEGVTAAPALAAGVDAEQLVVREVYYPKYMTPEHYLASQRAGGGFGALFSLTFSSILASRTFFDALPCYKGPSLGTNFTLACPYTILAHYTELEWAKEWGVEKGLIRVSTGLEEPEMLREWFETALDKAEAAVREARARGEVVE
ncbi:Cystathionine gamma-synthase [Rhodotorula kratochvilovae]